MARAPARRGDAPARAGPNHARLAGARRSASPATVLPQLAWPVAEPPSGEQWLHEIKFDGYRMLAHVSHGVVSLISRSGIAWTTRFPEIAEALGHLRVKEAWLDGEVVHLQPSGVSSFSQLQDDLSAGTTGNLTYMLFDLLYLDGEDLRGVSLEDRKTVLAALSKAYADGCVRYSDHQIGNGPALFVRACRLGLEGIVSKRRDSIYQAGRLGTWLKSKCVMRQEFVIIGFTDPHGERTGFGSLLLGYYTPDDKLIYAGKVGTGFSTTFLDEFYRRLRRIERTSPVATMPPGRSSRGVHWVNPQFVAEVAFAEWTSDHIVRQPRFIGLREDKAAVDVRLERPTQPPP